MIRLYLVKMKEEPKIIPNVPVCKLLKLADQESRRTKKSASASGNYTKSYASSSKRYSNT